MSFQFETFINNLREHPEKGISITKYETYLGAIHADIRQNSFYLNYNSKFRRIPYKALDGHENDFDWDLFLQLVVASFSTSYEFTLNEHNIPELEISVVSGERVVRQNLIDMWGFQIHRMFEIFLEELINLEVIRQEDEGEKNEIDSRRLFLLEQWNFRSRQIDAQRLIRGGDR
jgi:hypothetical protein